jgi:hypothetical protein
VLNKFRTWTTLIAPIGYLVFLTYIYFAHPKSLSDFTHKDVLLMFGALFSIVAIIRLLPLLRAKNGQAATSPLKSDSIEPLPTDALTASSPLSFGDKIKKKPGTLAVIFLFAFSLPPLLTLGSQGSAGQVFSRDYWHDVIIGELLMAVCLSAGWFIAKRKYEGTLKGR